MNDFQVKVKNADAEGRAPCLRPVFVWNARTEYDQFTVQVASDSEFGRLLFLRDTREHYMEFDSAPLYRNKMYYVRVRSGLGKWSSTSFVTGNR